MPVFTDEELSILQSYVVKYHNWLVKNVDNPVKQGLGHQPQVLVDFFANLILLRSLLNTRSSMDIEPELLPILKAVIIHSRRTEAFDIEKRSQLTFNHELRTKLEERLKLISDVMSQDWFINTQSSNSPRITDFLSIQYSEAIMMKNNSLQFRARDLDEKFQILTAPSLFLPDLAYYRTTCNLRGVPLCVAYLDIDDFKQFNTNYGEPRVDRDVLPKFMSALEAHVYSHGHAYRFGGDEYVVILPNMSSSQTTNLFRSFQKKLLRLKYFEIDEHTEVSIGVFEVTENSIQTDREIEERAAFAKNFAKQSGKNCIATYKDKGSADIDVYVISNQDLDAS